MRPLTFSLGTSTPCGVQRPCLRQTGKAQGVEEFINATDEGRWTTLRLVVAGTRKAVDEAVLRDRIARLNPSEVLHGGEPGSDAAVERVCMALGIPTRVVEPNYKKHGKAAQPIRNKLMLGMGDKALFMPCSRSRATATMVKQAMTRGVPFELWVQ